MFKPGDVAGHFVAIYPLDSVAVQDELKREFYGHDVRAQGRQYVRFA